MQKDFDRWNEVKKKTENEVNRLYTVREIWWCRLGINIGTEQDGKGGWYVRPCIILRGFGSSACLIVPITKSKREHVLRVPIGMVAGYEAKANVSQIRVIDTKRLTRKVCFLDKAVFEELRKTIKTLL